LQLKEFVQSTKGKYLFNFAMRSEPGTNRYFKNGVRQIQRTLKKVKEDAGVQKNASPHKFRHSYATHLFQGGTDILKIKELLGHSNIANTLVYTHFTKVQVEDHANPLDNLKLAGVDTQSSLKKRKRKQKTEIGKQNELVEEITKKLHEVEKLLSTLNKTIEK
jgi:hypothetical protein